VNPFRVACTTCNARLKVIDPAAIGQILSCPKCGSMVQVTPPPGWSPDAPAAAQSAESAIAGKSALTAQGAGKAGTSNLAASQSAIRDPASEDSEIQTAAERIAASAHDAASVLSDKPRSGSGQSSAPNQSRVATNSSTVLPASSRGGAKVVGGKVAPVMPKQRPGEVAPQPTPSTSSSARIMATSVAVASVANVAADPLAANRSAQPPLPAVMSSRWFWPALAAVALLCVVVVGIEIYLSHRSDDSVANADQVARSADGHRVAVTQPLAATSPSKTLPQSVSPAIPNPAVAPDPAKTAQPAAASTVDKTARTDKTDQTIAKAAALVVPPAARTPPASTAAAVAKTTAPGAATASAQPSTAFKPATGAQAIVAAVVNAEPATGPAVQDPAVLQVPAAPLPDKPEVANANRPAVPDAAVAAHPQPVHPSIDRIPPRDVDVEARLTDPLPGIDFQNVPLWRFADQISQVSTIPITLDLDQLVDLGLSADIAISVRAKEATVAGVLEEALAPHGLGWRVVNHQLLVGRAPSAPVRRVRFAVADLVSASGGDKRTENSGQRQFAEMVRKLVEPESWKEAGGPGIGEWSDGALMVEQSDAVHSQLIVLCEKLRVARRLPLKSRLDPERFRLETRTQRAKAALATSVTVNFARPEPLAHILAYLGQLTHVRLLPDQIALAEKRMSVDTEGFLTARNQPLAQSLATLLEPMALTYRVIDEHTIEITTAPAAAQHPELEFYPVRELLTSEVSGDALAVRLLRELAAAGLPNSAVQATAMHYDAPSEYLLVRAPQSTQLRIQSLLGSWRVARQ
jgi:hypothetical protein